MSRLPESGSPRKFYSTQKSADSFSEALQIFGFTFPNHQGRPSEFFELT